VTRAKISRRMNVQVRQEAAEWFVAFCEEDVGPRACAQFNDWLRTSPEHVRAYLRISAFWEDAEDLKKHARHGIDEIVRRAIAESNVVPIGEDSAVRQRRRMAPLPRWGMIAALMSACWRGADMTRLSALGRPFQIAADEPCRDPDTRQAAIIR